MGKPLTIKESDDERLLSLKKSIGANSKVEVLRRGLDLLEEQIKKKEKLQRWKRAAKAVSDSSIEVFEDFKSNPKRFENLP